ncbi:MAG: hypothetical protein FJW23_14755 [Acidimicrobiia bacterium]|nr:hypothetical protein [Acidimicrobiia bacterium]
MSVVLRTPYVYDLRRLADEAGIARGILDFSQGPYGNGVSLPSADQIIESHREHRNNVPFSGALERCPYMKEMFDSFQTGKAAFRLLRRGPKAAYAFHDDRDKGPRVARFQIPFVTSDRAFLLIANDRLDIRRFDTDGSGLAGDANGDVWFDMARLHRAGEGAIELYRLEAGYLHYFDTNDVHTLVNAADDERITLSLDVILNDWLTAWMASNLTERVPASPIVSSSAITWKWNALGHGIIRNTQGA